jgi:hypothetical protein
MGRFMSPDWAYVPAGFHTPHSLARKPLIPFFKKKNKTSVMPIQVTGTWRHAVVGARLVPKGK